MRSGLSRRTWGWALGFAALGTALCFVPLFDLLGYEASFALALAASLAGAHLGAASVWQARADASPSMLAGAEARPLRVVLSLFGATTLRVWALLLLPLFALSLN